MDELEPRCIPTRCTSWSCACTPTRCTPGVQLHCCKAAPPNRLRVHHQKKGYLTEQISLRLQLISSYSDFSPAAAAQKSSYTSPSLCKEKPAVAPIPNFPLERSGKAWWGLAPQQP